MCYMPHRKALVGVRELRQNLSIYLDRVKKGEALTVTEHGAPVAVLRPLPRAANALDRLVEGGHATGPSRSPRDLPRALRVKLDRSLRELLDAEREERL
jgi:prevent-host-death family protein